MAKLGIAKTLSAIVAGTGLAMIARRAVLMRNIAPEFRNLTALLPVPLSHRTLPLIRRATKWVGGGDKVDGVTVNERFAPADLETQRVRMLTFEREYRSPNSPVLIWLHGGGYVLGGPELDTRLFSRILETLDVLIVSVDYRLAPEHPFPAALDDANACLEWVRSNAIELEINPMRIGIGGVSAGAGLAAALVQLAVDTNGKGIVSQLLFYPMLDDRTVEEKHSAGVGRFIWTATNNRWAWKSYLGQAINGSVPPEYSVPARRHALVGFPLTWIGVGTLDLFRREAIDYGSRLNRSNGNCTIDIVEGAYHSFDTLAFESDAVKLFHKGMVDVLSKGFDA